MGSNRHKHDRLLRTCNGNNTCAPQPQAKRGPKILISRNFEEDVTTSVMPTGGLQPWDLCITRFPRAWTTALGRTRRRLDLTAINSTMTTKGIFHWCELIRMIQTSNETRIKYFFDYYDRTEITINIKDIRKTAFRNKKTRR